MNHLKELANKVQELESKLSKSSTASTFGAREFKNIINEFVDSKRFNIGTVSSASSGKAVIQLLIHINAEEVNSINIKVRAGGLLLSDIDRTLQVGDNEIFVMSSLMLASGEMLNVALDVTADAVKTNFLSSADMYVWSNNVYGKVGEESKINADISDDKFLLTMVFDEKIYYLESSNGMPDSIDFTSLNYYGEGKMADCVACFDSGNFVTQWFRLGNDNVLYVSKTANIQNEEVVVGGVEKMSVSAFGDRRGVIVCYIKEDGLPYYKTIENGVLSSELKFPAKTNKNYVDICALKSDSGFTYVTVTTSDDTNYLFEVAPEISLGGVANAKVNLTLLVSYS